MNAEQTMPDTLRIMETNLNLFDRTFRDSDGNVVIAQPPNLPLLVWLAATGLKLILVSGNLHLNRVARRHHLAPCLLVSWAHLDAIEKAHQSVDGFPLTLHGLLPLQAGEVSERRQQ